MHFTTGWVPLGWKGGQVPLGPGCQLGAPWASSGILGQRGSMAGWQPAFPIRETPPHLDPILRAQLARPAPSPQIVPFCVVLLALIGRPRWFSDCVFFCRIQIHGGVAGLDLVPSFCFCFCLERDPASLSHTHIHAPPSAAALILICCVPGRPNSLLASVSSTPPPSSPPPSFEIPTRHHDPQRRVAARDSLETATPPTESRSQTFKCTTARWVNHGQHEHPPLIPHEATASAVACFLPACACSTWIWTLTIFGTQQPRTYRMA